MIEIKDIRKSYRTGDFVQRALDGVSITFRESEFVAVLGPSGSGKTTFLNILGGFDHADSGDIVINGVSTKDYRDKDWDTYRNHRIGFVFQGYNLIPHQTVLANVELALTLAGVSRASRRDRALRALERVGLGEHANKKPGQLSGGQMQRVAIARALVNDPEIVLADEPTGALDTETGIQVMDILAEVARDRLVIMVTHNPQLAQDYATRIVRIKDGRIVDDSNPPTAAELMAAQQATTADAPGTATPSRHSSMGFLTALALSANNLLTKKGRTIMTAFAGSIGIIGIAAILALSNGVNGYIARVEEDMLSSYPLSISKQSYDITSMLTGDASAGTSDASSDATPGAGADGPSGRDGSAVVDTSAQIPRLNMLKDMFASVKSNDLTSFKAYLDSGPDGLADNVNAVKYDYGVTPLVYKSDTSSGPVKLNPNSLSTAMSGGASSAAMAGTMMGSSAAFNEMLDDTDLLSQQYDVVAGRWASAADECVLVLSKSGKVSDYTLYSIGVLDPSELDRMVDATMTASGDVDVPDSDANFSYDDALGTTFKVLSPSDAYRKNDETGGWTDMSDDADFMAAKVAEGLDLKVVGVVKPNETSSASSLMPGIAYTHDLTTELMGRAASSPIVRQQLANPDVDVFTGKGFQTLQDEAKQGVDLSSLFSVDEAKLKRAFTFDASGLGAALDLPGLDVSGLDMGNVSIDLSGVGRNVDWQSLVAGAPAPDFSAIFEGVDPNLDITPEDLARLGEAGNALVRGYLASLGPDIRLDDPELAGKLAAKFKEYLATDEAKAQLDVVAQIAGEPAREAMRQVLQNYVTTQLAPYMQQVFQSLSGQIGSQISDAVSGQLQAGLSAAMASAMQGMSAAIASQLSSGMRNALKVDAGAFASAIHFNMDAADLASLMTSYANASRLTYDNNLSTLGYAAEDDPISISIYPRDFEAKERVLGVIDRYNDDMRAAGKDDQVIGYTDYMGVIMGSVTDIVNMISLVLIAFVSISLVVSSIMIGIITYISVLERRKEIGILRAMGASKRNVANVFNAETFIEGLIAGVFAIAVVLVVSVPVNAWVLKVYAVDNIMSLPWGSALGLIAISIVLTLVAGLIPSMGASGRDPVEALRSE